MLKYHLLKRLILPVFMLGLVLCAGTFVRAQKYEPLLGIWDVETENGQYTFEFKFFLKEGKLAGIFTGQAGESEMEDLTFEDNKVVFLVTIDAGGQEMSIDFTATIDGDNLEGMLALEFGEANIVGKKRK